MAQFVIGLIVTAILVRMSFLANERFQDQIRLPMQWFLSGEVTWTAPRRLALAFIPALAIPIIWATVALTIFVPPRPGQEGFEIPVTPLHGRDIRCGPLSAYLAYRQAFETERRLTGPSRNPHRWVRSACVIDLP